MFGVEAIAPFDAVPPLREGRLGAAAGVTVRDTTTGRTADVRARYLVVADGANSRLGRSLGAARRRDWPMGMALRGYWTSPRHDDAYIESHIDIRDANGDVVPGYGWIFPLGDGRVNVGVGLLSTDRTWKGVNTTRLMDAFLAQAAPSWELSASTLPRPGDGRQAADGAVGRSQHRRQRRRHRRRGGGDQPVQRGGHRLRLRDRAAGGGLGGRGASRRTTPRRSRSTESGSTRPTGTTSEWRAASSG